MPFKPPDVLEIRKEAWWFCYDLKLHKGIAINP